MANIRKPRFSPCDCNPYTLNPVECWRKNHMPYIGVIHWRKRGNYSSTYSVIFTRYVQIKKIVWPDAAKKFLRLYMEKHPEMARARDYGSWDYFGAYAYKTNAWFMARPLFGLYGILGGQPYTPKPEFRDKIFNKLALQRLMDDLTKQHKEESCRTLLR